MRLLACMVFGVGAASAQAPAPTPVTSDSAFVRILAEYRKLGAKPAVNELVRLYKETDDAVYAFEVGITASYVRTPKVPLRLTGDFAEIGVFRSTADTNALLHSLKLLREAHAADPNSNHRSLTLFATLFPDTPDPLDPLAIGPAKDYLDEFPNANESKRVVVTLAHFYDDLNKMVRDSMKGPNNVIGYRMPCFKPYFTTEPLADQFAAARDSALRYYNRALNLIPQNPALREQRLLINGGNNSSWYLCNE
jgi:hypothetical protein